MVAKNPKENILTHENYIKLKLWCHKSFPAHSHPLHLHVVYGCPHAAVSRVEKLQQKPPAPQSLKYLPSVPLHKKFVTAGLNLQTGIKCCSEYRPEKQCEFEKESFTCMLILVHGTSSMCIP